MNSHHVYLDFPKRFWGIPNHQYEKPRKVLENGKSLAKLYLTNVFLDLTNFWGCAGYEYEEHLIPTHTLLSVKLLDTPMKRYLPLI